MVLTGVVEILTVVDSGARDVEATVVLIVVRIWVVGVNRTVVMMGGVVTTGCAVVST